MQTNQTIIIPFIVFLLSSCGNKQEKQQPKAEKRNTPIVLTCNPQIHRFNAALQISGTAKPNQQVKIFAMTNGIVRKINVDIGAFVGQGQVLARLDNPELIQQNERIKADLKGKKSIYDRLKHVYQKTPQLIAISEVDKARAAYESAVAQQRGLQVQIDFLQLRAPFAGVITNRLVDKGAIIQNGLNSPNAIPLFEIQDLRPIRLQIDIPETDAVLISKKTKVKIIFPELPNGAFYAAISRIAYGLDKITKTMKAEIDLPNNDLKIRPGMYAKVELQKSGHKNVLSVPNEAIGNVKGQSFVYIVQDSKVKKIKIEIGIHDDKFSELLNAEIKATDKIVLQGKEFCAEGATVKAIEQD